jgi:hypothetical protein
VDAIEKSGKARLFAKEHFELDLLSPERLTGYLPDTFDVITLWHVIEHIEKMNEAGSTFHRLLNANGILVVAVPNGASYDAQKYKEAWAAYDVPRHLWHFTPATMQRFGTKHGFVLTARYPMPFDSFYISMLSEKGLKSSFPFLRGSCNGAKGWLSTVGNKERSSSMVYVFKKKGE